MEMNKPYHGAAIDKRPPAKQAQDIQSIEIASIGPVAWREKRPSTWRKFPIRDQNGSDTCVAQTGAKMLGIENFIEENKFIAFSAAPIYNKRLNKPQHGMGGGDALNILSKHGTTTEERIPSQHMDNGQIAAIKAFDDEDKKIADTYRGGGYVHLPIDIDAIGDIIENKRKGVMLFIFATWQEWTDTPTIRDTHLTLHNAPIRHSVTGVDTLFYNGQKAILIDDSWGEFVAFKGQRILTQEFLEKRCYFAGYLKDLSNKRDDLQPKPKLFFSRPLSYGMMNNREVKLLQDMLKYEELFPQKTESTGNFLQLTAKGVRIWQLKNGIMDFANETDMRNIRFGAKSIKKANEKYS